MMTFVDTHGRRRYVDDDLIKDAFDFLIDYDDDIDLTESELSCCPPVIDPAYRHRLTSLLARLDGRNA